jgi:hypothetical protein
MKKLILLISLVALLATAFISSKKAEFTVLGDGTPYYLYPEKMLGRVEKVIEKNYWAVPDGESFKKGNPLTKKDRDSIGGWTDDIEVTYNNTGELVSCNNINELGKSIRIYKVSKDKDGSVKGENYMSDTLNYYDKYKLDNKGNRIGFVRFRPKVDTMTGTCDIQTNPAGDTVEYHAVNAKGKSMYKLIIVFDAAGQFLRSEGFNKEGISQFSNEVKYNDKGKVSEQIGYDKDKKVTYSATYTYVYDSKGNWIKAIGKTGNKLVVFTERTYTYF